MVGGDSDVLTVTSVVYRSPGEGGSLGRGRGRGLGRGWGSGWGVRPPVANSPATVKDAKGTYIVVTVCLYLGVWVALNRAKLDF